ncbi:MAG: PD-(D/E)XK nuclease family protein [Phycisphaerae bacterium]
MSASEEQLDCVAARRKLDAFLVDNNELEALNGRLARFNSFRILRIEQAEIRHSNVLAWLLTPNETHGLGPHFLRRFLSRLLLENEDIDVSLTPSRVELMPFDDVEVRREWRRIDLLAISDSGGWCLLIENKVGSRESKGQLIRYKRVVQEEFPGRDLLPVYLTLDGEDPSKKGTEAGYIPLSYAQILELADRAVEQHGSHIPDDVRVFLDHYRSTLRRLTMQDHELIDLCKTIYGRHREAIDLIVQYGTASQVLDACEAKIPKLIETEFVHRTPNFLWFLPRAMAECQPEITLTGWTFLPRRFPVMCWYHLIRKTGTLYLVIEVGPIEDSSLRIRLMHAIKDGGFSFWEKGAFRKTAKYTRILSQKKKLQQKEDGTVDDDPDYVQQVAASMWKKHWQDGKKIVEILKAFDWSR